MPVARFLLRLVAVLGPIAVVGWELVSLPAPRPRQDWGIVVLCLAGLAGLGFLALTPRAFATMFRRPDLLVPLGVTVTLGGAVSWLASLTVLAAFAGPVWQREVLGLSLAVSVPLLAYILLAVLHAGWTTCLVLQAAGEREWMDVAAPPAGILEVEMVRDRNSGRVDLLAPLAHPGRWFWRTLGVLALGIAVLLILSAVGLAIAAVALPVGLILMGLAALFWNLRTAALLLGVLRSRGPFLSALGEGFRESRRGRGRSWGVVILHMVLLGWVTFLHFSFTTVDGGQTSTQTKTDWSVNAFWTGGYEAGCRWYERLVKVADSQTLPPIDTLLALLFGVVAVAVKLTVAQRMEPQTGEEDEAGFDHVEPARLSPAGGAVLTFVALGALVAMCSGLIFQQELARGLLKLQFRRAVAQGQSPEAVQAMLAGRSDVMELAEQLSQDPDPRVRRTLIGPLVSGATPAQPPESHGGVVVQSWTGFHEKAVLVLERLLEDPDPKVRLETVRAVTARRAADQLRKPLLRVLHSGAVAERVAVAESLVFWDTEAFAETLADGTQPAEVRLALLRGADHYGWDPIHGLGLLDPIKKAMTDPDRELRRAAIDALRHFEEGPALWLEVLRGPEADDRRAAFRSWVDTLVNDPPEPSEFSPRLGNTEDLLSRGEPLIEGAPPAKDQGREGERIALVIHVLCSAARENAAILDRSPPVSWQEALFERNRGGGPAAAAFMMELRRLQVILRALNAGVNLVADPRYSRPSFAIRMPDEAGKGPPPPRKLRDFLRGQMKEPLAWCRQHAGGYASPFLRVNANLSFDIDPGPQGGQPRTLGQVLAVLHLDTDAALDQYIKERANP